MVSSGLTAVLIKVAGVGLDESDLGKTLGQMQGKLTRLVSSSFECCASLARVELAASWTGHFSQIFGVRRIYLELNFLAFFQNEMYGLHICGEGGEYETLTLDCPLFYDRVQL